MTLQIVASLIDAARGVIYDRHMFIVQATGHKYKTRFEVADSDNGNHTRDY